MGGDNSQRKKGQKNEVKNCETSLLLDIPCGPVIYLRFNSNYGFT